MGRLGWLGGRDSAKTDAQSVRRARAHRRSIPRAAAAEERFEQTDRGRFGRDPFYRRNNR